MIYPNAELNAYIKAAGKYRKQAGDAGMLTKDYQRQLLVLAQLPLRLREQGQEPSPEQLRQAQAARDQMVRQNTLLAVKMAQRYLPQGSTLDDLVSEGVLGLFKAVEMFDLGRDVKFCTYATIWIRQRIQRHLDNESVVHEPTAIRAHRRRYWTLSHQLSHQFGHNSTQDQLDERMPLDGHVLRAIHAQIYSTGEVEDHQHELADYRFDAPERRAEQRELDEQVRRLLELLPARLRLVLERRMGLGCEPMTLEQVGAELKVTRERVRQIEAAALAKLKRLGDPVFNLASA